LTSSPPSYAASPKRSTGSLPAASFPPTKSKDAASSTEARSATGFSPATKAPSSIKTNQGGEQWRRSTPTGSVKGKRRYSVRYRDGDGRQRSRAFATQKDAYVFKLEVERRLAVGGRRAPHTVKGRRLFNEGEVREWLRSRHRGSTLDGNEAER